MVNCNGVYVREGLRLPIHAVRVAVPVTDSAGNTSIVLKQLQNARKGHAKNRDDVITDKELSDLGGIFQVVVTTPDGPVAGMTIDPRNCFGTNGRKFDLRGSDGDPLRAMPAESRRALARQVLHGGISYGVNDPELSAARLSWVMRELPFEELILASQGAASSVADLLTGSGPRDAQGRMFDRRLTENKNLASALVVRAAVEGTGFLRENPTLTLLLADHLKVSVGLDSPHWLTKSNTRKLGAMDRALARVTGEIYDLLTELENPQTRLSALAALGDSPETDNARAASALFDPDASIRSMAAAAITDPSIRLEAAAVLSQLNVRDDVQDPLMPYRELLAPMRKFDDTSLQGLVNLVPLLPAEARAYVYGEIATQKFTKSISNEHTRSAVRDLLENESDPFIVARHLERNVQQGGWASKVHAGFDDGLTRRLEGAVSKEDGWVPSAAFDLFSADTAAGILIASYLPQGRRSAAIEESGVPSAPCHDAWLRAALVERLLGELANPNLDTTQRERYVYALRSAAAYEPVTEVRSRILASESLAERIDTEEVASLYRRSARFDTEASLRSRAAAQLADDDPTKQLFNSGADDRQRVETFRHSTANLPHESWAYRSLSPDGSTPVILPQRSYSASLKHSTGDTGPSSSTTPLEESLEAPLEAFLDREHYDVTHPTRGSDYLRMGKTDRAELNPLAFRESVVSALRNNVPPRMHNGELCALMGVGDMSPAEQAQLVNAVRIAHSTVDIEHDRTQARKWGHESRAFYYDCLLGDVIFEGDTPVAVEAALAFSDPLEGLRYLVNTLDDGKKALPDEGALRELVRRATTSSTGEVLEQTPQWLLTARAAKPEGSPTRDLLDRCIAACPGGWEHTADSSDAQARLMAARSVPRPDNSLVLQELAVGAVPAALALVDRVEPAALRTLEEDVATVPDSPSRDIVLAQVRARISAVAGQPTEQTTIEVSEPAAHNNAPVVNWYGDTPIRIHYESHGSPSDEPVVLLMGQMMQLNAWPEPFVTGLVEAGRRVILVDNRDIGLSTKLVGVPVDSDAVVAATLTGRRPAAPYSLGDMADDVAGLLEHLNIPQAQIVGQSMGGMIAQEMAIRHPHKVSSVVSLSSMTGDPMQMQSTPEAMLAVTSVPAFTGDPETDREVFVEHSVVYQAFASRKFRDDERSKLAAAASWDRATPDEGSFPRQLAAIYASGDRTDALAEVAAARGPGFATFIHGADDTLICPQAARHAATRCSPASGALVVLEDMGHDLPVELCDRVVSLIVTGGSK